MPVSRQHLIVCYISLGLFRRIFSVYDARLLFTAMPIERTAFFCNMLARQQKATSVVRRLAFSGRHLWRHLCLHIAFAFRNLTYWKDKCSGLRVNDGLMILVRENIHVSPIQNGLASFCL